MTLVAFSFNGGASDIISRMVVVPVIVVVTTFGAVMVIVNPSIAVNNSKNTGNANITGN